MGNDSSTEGRGFSGRDYWSWVLKDEWEFTGLRCHSPKVEMILVHMACLLELGKAPLLPLYSHLSENCPNFRKSAMSMICAPGVVSAHRVILCTTLITVLQLWENQAKRGKELPIPPALREA